MLLPFMPLSIRGKTPPDVLVNSSEAPATPLFTAALPPPLIMLVIWLSTKAPAKSLFKLAVLFVFNKKAMVKSVAPPATGCNPVQLLALLQLPAAELVAMFRMDANKFVGCVRV